MVFEMLTGAAGRAYRALAPVVDVTNVDKNAARAVINAARGDIDKALGAVRGKAFSSELHAASMNARQGISNGVIDVSAGLFELQRVGERTATRRIMIGGAAIVGGALGASWLLNQARRADDNEMAPGPFHFPPNDGVYY